ncbi:MAG TPA: hypothetical protein VF581_00410 [Flavobacterium sp.]|jgi:uncharacterized protein YbcV (DUF1398 family)
MISVQVSYRVDPEFVQQNIVNINKFLSDFKLMKGFNYSVFLKSDQCTFVHMSEYENEDIQQQVLNVPSFLEFQRQRDQSGLNDSHTVEMLTKIGSSIA